MAQDNPYFLFYYLVFHINYWLFRSLFSSLLRELNYLADSIIFTLHNSILDIKCN